MTNRDGLIEALRGTAGMEDGIDGKTAPEL